MAVYMLSIYFQLLQKVGEYHSNGTTSNALGYLKPNISAFIPNLKGLGTDTIYDASASNV